MYVHVLPGVRKPWIKIQRLAERAVEYSEWQLF